MKEVTVSIVAIMSKERFRDFLQKLRDFDMKYDSQIQFHIMTEAPEMTVGEVQEIFDSVKPPMPFSSFLSFKDGSYTELPPRASN